MKNEELILKCACRNEDHIMEINIHDDEVIIEVKMNKLNNIFVRTYIAIRYILGINTRDQWDVVILHKEEKDNLIDFLK